MQAKRSISGWLKRHVKELTYGVVIALIVTAIFAVPRWLETKSTWHLNRPANGEASIRPIIDMMAQPELAEPCSKARWWRWLLRQECIRLTVQPPGLADLRTRRLPFKETGEPFRLLELFVNRHDGCLILQREGDSVFIREAKPSRIHRVNDQLICPE